MRLSRRYHVFLICLAALRKATPDQHPILASLGQSSSMNQRRSHSLVFALLALHGGLLAFIAAEHSPVISEAKHLPAGLSHLYLGRFDLFRVNPPLVRTAAALPVARCCPRRPGKAMGLFRLRGTM